MRARHWLMQYHLIQYPFFFVARIPNESSTQESASSQSNAIPFNHQASSDSIVSLSTEKAQQPMSGYSIPYSAMRK